MAQTTPSDTYSRIALRDLVKHRPPPAAAEHREKERALLHDLIEQAASLFRDYGYQAEREEGAAAWWFTVVEGVVLRIYDTRGIEEHEGIKTTLTVGDEQKPGPGIFSGYHMASTEFDPGLNILIGINGTPIDLLVTSIVGTLRNLVPAPKPPLLIPSRRTINKNAR